MSIYDKAIKLGMLDSGYHRTGNYPNGVIDHYFTHGTFTRGYGASHCSAAKRNKNRTKNKIARTTRRLNPILPRTGNRSTGR
jgi:hypothetical protein